MVYGKNQLNTDQLLDMISSFQWLPDTASVRLMVNLNPEDRVLKSLNKFAYELERQQEKEHMFEDHHRLILGTLDHHSDLMSANSCKEILTEAKRVIDTIGLGPALIGITNLYTTAYALTIRSTTPARWNHFCEHVDKFDWLTEIANDSSDDASSSINGPSVDIARTNDVTHTALSYTNENQRDQIRGGGLVHAFNDQEFTAVADKLLDNGDNMEPQHSIESETEYKPKIVTPFHRLIQERYTPARYNKTGKAKSKGM